ncbi:MAG: hypothetical protein A2908_01100 [Candidatus Staskawiczbacteria bacterium RIFCSPLOWO2_01_FULL_38_12b]|uniref:GrpB family protein n=1 Tax=Candidatus Staskawiczbacteria bacterium RIFCSPLOWO2_01_FULL_38_12b TaxID=1802214 RepID=A0A1G2IFB2_9BACT|nr:MAG: hypothetical protein A2908_01100 [Candidatus Staskawiczbacteria bacterium RIFCSPLOWO2_01_FULL_38_12b]
MKKGVVKLKKHNANWAKLFEKEKKLLLKEFPDIILEIHHGGSTAIPNIPAKPIIDMFAEISSLKKVKTRKILEDLQKLGYNFYSEDKKNNRILYVKGDPKISTHHLHFVKKDSPELKKTLIFKEYLLKNPKVAKDYSGFKLMLAKKYPKDRRAYTTSKDKFIKSVIKKAKI